MQEPRAEWGIGRISARARDEARRAEATIRPMRGLVLVPAIHVLGAEPVDPFWRTLPPARPADDPQAAEAAEAPEAPQRAVRRPRDPWAVLPDPVRILSDPDGFRRALVAERVWLGGTAFLPELFVQRLHATLRIARAARPAPSAQPCTPAGFHADLRGCAEETRAWALEAADRAGLDPVTWRLAVEAVESWTVDPAEVGRLPHAPNAKPDPDPVYEALAVVNERQRFLNRAEYSRVDGAVLAWRAALQQEDEPGAENTPYQNGFFQDLGLQLGVTGRTAKSMVRIADRLARVLPTVWARFAAAEAPWKTMQAAHAAIDGMSEDEVLALFDTEAAALIGEIPTVQLPDALRRLAERLQPTTLDDRFGRAFARRFVRIEPAPDGMGWLTAFLPMVTLAAVDDQLTKAAVAEHDRAGGATGGITVLRADILADGLVDALSRDAEPGPAVEPPTPTTGQADDLDAADDDDEDAADRSDADAADHGDAADGDAGDGDAGDGDAGDGDAADGDAADERLSGPRVPARRGVQAKVGILIPAMTALGHSDAPAILEGYGPIGMATALRLAGEATSWIRVLTDPFTGTVITVGREKYRPTSDMRAMLRMLDGGGRGPGCTRPPSQTEVDHNRSFRLNGEQGETSVRNLVLLSNRDHAGKTAGESTADLLPDRTLLWETRAGNRYVTRPHDPPVPTPIPPALIDPGDLEGCPF